MAKNSGTRLIVAVKRERNEEIYRDIPVCASLPISEVSGRLPQGMLSGLWIGFPKESRLSS